MNRQESDRRIRDWWIRQESGAAINRWLDEKGDDVFSYIHKVNRSADISDIVMGSIQKVDQMDLSKFSLIEDGPDHFLLRYGCGKPKRVFRELFP